MQEITANVNWLAVLVGAVVAYALGWLWYSPKLFGNKWAEGVGVTCDGSSPLPMAAMIVQAIGTFLLAWVVGVTAVSNALVTLILIMLTIIALMVGGGLYAEKSHQVLAIEAGYVVVMVIVMVVCQAIF